MDRVALADVAAGYVQNKNFQKLSDSSLALVRGEKMNSTMPAELVGSYETVWCGVGAMATPIPNADSGGPGGALATASPPISIAEAERIAAEDYGIVARRNVCPGRRTSTFDSVAARRRCF